MAKTTGKVIKRARLERQWTQERLAAEAECSAATIVALEKGHTNGQDRTLFRIARALDLDPDDLLETEVAS